MQRLLVKLLQQLQGSGTTNDQRLQRLLLTACCGWLRALCLESAAVGNCSVSFCFKLLLDNCHVVDAAVTAMSCCYTVSVASTTQGPVLYSLSVVSCMLAEFDSGCCTTYA